MQGTLPRGSAKKHELGLGHVKSVWTNITGFELELYPFLVSLEAQRVENKVIVAKLPSCSKNMHRRYP